MNAYELSIKNYIIKITNSFVGKILIK